METRKVNINRPKVSSSEIQAKQNFAQVESAAKLASKAFYQTTWFGATMASVAIIAVASVLWFNHDPEKQETAAKTDKIESDSTKTLIAYAEDKPCILPPKPSKDKAFDIYTVDASKDGTFTHHTGSEVRFPKGSIVDENGNLVSGDVDIQYREFHNQMDILFSGIPMQYDSAGYNYTFESAGMMQIFGYQNGKQVFVNPEKPIEVKMISHYEGEKYNLYELDTNARNWVNKGKDEIVYEDEPNDVLAIAISSDGDGEIPADTIYSPLHNIKKDVDFTYTTKEQKKKEWIQAKKEVQTVEKSAPKSPETFDESLPQFDLEVDPKEFPEIAVYKGVNFQPLPNERFSLNFGNTVWNSIELNKTSEENIYLVTLKKGDLVEEFKAQPVFEGEDLEQAKKVFEEKFKDYSKKLEEKQKEEAQKLAEYEEAKQQWEDAKKKYEAEMKARQQREENKKRMFDNTQKMYRTFNVTNFGTWNCDSPVKPPSGRSVLAKFKHKVTGVLLTFPTLMLIEKAKNAVFNLSGEKIRKLSFNPKEDNILVGFLPTGEMAIVRPADFKEVGFGTHEYEFEMEIREVDDLSKKEIEAWVMG